VIWSHVTWGVGSTTVAGKTYEEDLYNTERTNLVQVTSSDLNFYSYYTNIKSAWQLAFTWANNIRSPIKGINVDDKPIYKLQAATSSTALSDFGKWTVSYYGAGEAQPSLYVATGEFFHTNDLVVAKSPESSFETNTWVKLTVEVFLITLQEQLDRQLSLVQLKVLIYFFSAFSDSCNNP
jgi:hypothetical protein